EIGFVSWVGLRGAVSILLAIMPILGWLENGQIYFNTAFIIVLFSLLLQGWTIKPVAKKLGLIIRDARRSAAVFACAFVA
ncbi:cation:proton antiporter domain-containing protein, partial [Rhizobium johnstonii]|uniref:cation:proton antiporter domain-containing protein n=1 Tax=Rhizobium johnstonii TaxID=3019933 RepID=UPI003F9AEA15